MILVGGMAFSHGGTQLAWCFVFNEHREMTWGFIKEFALVRAWACVHQSATAIIR